MKTEDSIFDKGFLFFLANAYFFLAIFIFLTGGSPLIPDALAGLFQTKPWLQRALVTAAVLPAFFIFAFYEERHRRYQTPRLFINRFFIQLNFSPKIWLWVLFLIFFTVLSISSIVRFEVFHAGFDMAIFTQAVWNTAQGNFLYSSIKGGICLLADHFSPLLAVLAVPYKIWPNPWLLLMLQALAVAACVFPVYRLTCQKTKNFYLAVIFVLAFIFYLPNRNAARFEFHPELLVMPALFWAYLFLTARQIWRSSLLLLVALSAKEGISLVTFGMGFYAFFFLPKQRRFGLFWMFFSVFYFFLITKWVLPAVLGQSYFYLPLTFDSVSFAQTGELIKRVIRMESLLYLFKIFMPLGFLSFLTPAAVLTFPILLQNLIIPMPQVRSIFFQYTVLLTPFVFISAISGFATMKQQRFAAYWLVFCTLLMSGVSEYSVIRQEGSAWRPEFRTFKTLMAQIPEEASVRTHEFFAPHLAHRKELHIYENTHPLEGGSETAMAAEYVVLWEKLLGNPSAVKAELKNRGYHQTIQQAGLMIFSKR